MNEDISTNIPIWPGSSSYTTGSTPFGLFDTDSQFRSDADKVAKWCAYRLGYPIADIELQDVNFWACFEESISEYSRQVNEFNIRDNILLLQGSSTGSNFTGRNISVTNARVIDIATEYGTEAGSGGNVTWHTASIDVIRDIQRYDLDAMMSGSSFPGAGQDIEIKRIFHNAPPASLRFFDPYLGNQTMLDTFGFGNYSTGVSFMMMPMYADLLRIQAIEFNDQMRKSAYGFELINNQLTLFPVPTKNFKLWFQYIIKSDRSNPLRDNGGVVSDMSNAPYNTMVYSEINSVGKKWIWDYTLACAKEMLGYVRGKYSSIPIPNGDLSLNVADLISAAQQEKEKLVTDLRESLDEMSRVKQMERRKSESESLRMQLTMMPSKIYVG